MDPTPVIVHLSGAHRGTTQRLFGQQLRLALFPDAEIPIAVADLPPWGERATEDGEVARLERRGESYELVATSELGLWVNGEPTRRRLLVSGDVIEVGSGGPVLRYRLYAPGSRAFKSFREVFTDCFDCARYGARSAGKRLAIMAAGAPWELATQTSPVLRLALAGVLVLLLFLLGGTGWLWYRNIRLEQSLAIERARVEGLARLLDQAEQHSFSTRDFAATQAELRESFVETQARLQTVEDRLGARERVIEAASRSVVFLQAAYGFAEPGTGRPLRLAGLGPDGPPLTGPGGEPVVTFDGAGPVVEIFYTGTAFVASDEGHLLTNRHVAEPWTYDEHAQMITEQGLEPEMRQFVGYLPGEAEPFPVEMVRASERADVALLRCTASTETIRPLELARREPVAGDEVIVLGYPTGLQALIVRAEPEFVEGLLEENVQDFWELGRRLAAGGYIEPLATVGVVGQVTGSSIVYDAETTHGGSGGPVLGLDGKVVAVNAAVVPEFGGSNLGVPARAALTLLAPPPADP
jgi:S1-C subfamily serine protease